MNDADGVFPHRRKANGKKTMDENDRARAGELPSDPKDGASLVSVPPGMFRLTDIGNAERFVARYREQIRYCPPRKRWLIWLGQRWTWDDRSKVVQFAKATVRGIYEEAAYATDDKLREATAKHARASERSARVQAMIQLAQSEDGIPVLPHELDADPWAFNVANGTIDLRTGKLRPHRRGDLITKLSPVDYEPGARSDLWERYLSDATGGDADLSAYLQRAVGYALQGTIKEKAFWFLHGPPDGMKSTFIDAIDGALGEYHVPTSFETWLTQSNVGGNRGDLVRLLGARLVSSVEVRKGSRFDEAIIKAVTGGDAITAAAKYEAELTFYATFALWLAANDAPTIRDDDEGAWSRVRRIPFTHPLPKDQQDANMRERLREPAERAAILAWAVDGCLAWQRDGMGSCAAVDASSAAYRAEMDRVAGFFDERCAFGRDAKVNTSALRHSYEEWCREQGVRVPLSGKDFAARLHDRQCEQGKSNGKRVWRGVRLLEAWEDAGGDGRDSRDVGSLKPSHGEFNGCLSGDACPADPYVPAPELFDEPAERAAIQGEAGE